MEKKTKTIVMIEDNRLNRKLVRALLREKGVEILEAIDAESGILLIREEKPDLVLMDVQLPGMDGLTATSIIKNDPVLKEIPVIVLTSYAMAGDAEKARSAGCDSYMAKPIEIHSFRHIVQDLLHPCKEKAI
jgi:CheY-like chemotaxis protein